MRQKPSSGLSSADRNVLGLARTLAVGKSFPGQSNLPLEPECAN